jgi:hypothetical protein
VVDEFGDAWGADRLGGVAAFLVAVLRRVGLGVTRGSAGCECERRLVSAVGWERL